MNNIKPTKMMNTKNKLSKTLFYLSIILALLTLSWIVLMAISMGDKGPLINDIETALEFVNDPTPVFYLNYINVIILTIINTAFYGFLYLYFKEKSPILSIAGILFIPVYTAYNLFSYTAQISTVQQIQEIYTLPELQATVTVLLSQLVQAYNYSGASFLNNYAYALLGIPSIGFGIAFLGESTISKLTGWFLIANAVACIVGVIGIIMGNQILSMGSAVGGIFFLVFLVFAAVYFRNGKI